MTIDEINIKKQALVSNMKNYIDIFIEDGEEEPYSPSDAEECGLIIDNYIAYLFAQKRTDEEIIAQVETTVKELNMLNEKCDHSLIETDEREQLCAIIIEAARLCDYQFPIDDDDITFEWRDW